MEGVSSCIPILLRQRLTNFSVDRMDNVLVMSSGDKFIPGPIEDIISTCPAIQHTIVFGAGQLYTGAIIQLKHTEPHELNEELYKAQVWFVLYLP